MMERRVIERMKTIQFPFPSDGKRYHTWNSHLRHTFGKKIAKISLDAGFDCPNRDGTVAHGGCTFCSVAGSGDFAGDRVDPIAVQFQTIKARSKEKWQDAQYIAFFQAYTNTHAPLPVLKEKFEAALQLPGVIGLSIATRPDCLPEDVLDYLAELNTRTHLWVELGLQTIHEETATLINRAHTFQTYIEGVEQLRKRNISIVSHIINGLPGESIEMMMETAREVAKLDIQGLKIHLLHLLKGTPMVKQYERGKLQFLTREEYIQLVVDQLELIPQHVVIHRITGDGPVKDLIGPMWSVSKWEVLNAIDRELERRESYQGKGVLQ